MLAVLLTTLALGLADAPADDGPYDLVIANGRVVDGTGNPWFRADVAVRGDRIVAVATPGSLAGAEAKERVDATGLVVAPGFIDILAHSREYLLTGDSRLIGKVTQGVTSEILGEGASDAPARKPAAFDGEGGFGRWLDAIEARGASVNFGSFVGSATVRQYVKGMAPGPPSAVELDAMRVLVRDAMEGGAFGLASALIYPPDSYVGTADLIELARVMAPMGGIYATHVRSESDRLIEAIDEAIAIGREGGVPVEIYHLKAAGRRNWPKAAEAIARIAAARAAGLDVGANVYPYVAGGTGLTACLPPWASADGKLYENLLDPAARARIAAEVAGPAADWENLAELAGPEGVLVLGLEKPQNARYAGRTLAAIAEEQEKPWIAAAMDLLLVERQRIGCVYFLMDEEDVRLIIRQPWVKFGTDAGGHDPAKPPGLVHPRSYGTYPRILGRYVRDEGLIPLEEAVRKMTSAVADRLSLRDRGQVRPGFAADLVLFDPATIADRATFEAPHQLSVGVRHVYVNGVAVLLDGRHTGAKPGRALRGPGYKQQEN